jgi:uncharacterized protein
MHQIQTFSGQLIDPLAGPMPCPLIADIAHSLAQICRFTGHTKTFWSVAHHSLACYYVAPAEARRHCLLHDAAEAYLGDWARPVKYRLPVIIAADRCLQARINHVFKVAEHDATKHIDDAACDVERWLLCHGPQVEDHWGLAKEIDWLRWVSIPGAKELFLQAECESRGS